MYYVSNEFFILLIMLGVAGVLFGVIYPAFMAVIYPIYKELGGKMKFKDYMNNI